MTTENKWLLVWNARAKFALREKHNNSFFAPIPCIAHKHILQANLCLMLKKYASQILFPFVEQKSLANKITQI